MQLAHSLHRFRGRMLLFSTLLGVAMTAGCQSLNPWSSSSSDSKAKDEPKSADATAPTQDTTVVRAMHAQPAGANVAREVDPIFLDAEEFYRLENYKRASELFHKVAENTKNPPLTAEKARFFEAESKKQLGELADAMSTYNRLLNDFSFGVYREQAVARMYDIAMFWLKDTWKQLKMEEEKEEGKRWFVPSNFIHFDKAKPTFDEEAHAVHMLEQVYYNDPTGPYADKALYYIGYVNFKRGHYREADQFLTALVQMDDLNGKRTEMRDAAWQLVVYAKLNSTGGPLYDGRKNSEALKIIQQAQATVPKFAADNGDWISRQQETIRFAQAEKDFALGEYYRRTGHPASAWFYYELVRRRYRDTRFEKMAIANMMDLQRQLKESKDPSFTSETSRLLTKAFLGNDAPRLEPGKEVPNVPGVVPQTPTAIVNDPGVVPQTPNPVVPVGGVQGQAIPK